MESINEMKSALEAMMFVWGSPLEVRSAAEALEADKETVRLCLEELASDYDKRKSGIMIREINGKYQFCTRPEEEPYIARLCTPVREKRLSDAAMEVLTIVAYRQPVSRSDIDHIRGIKCDRVLDGLIKRGLVRECGHGTGLGRPVLFATTDLFLEKFGISSLDQLPEIEGFSE